MNIESLDKLMSVCILDGRNRNKLIILRDYFSEFALIKYRILVETQYLIFLSINTGFVPKLKNSDILKIKSIHDRFSPQKALKVKKIENKINHDVKAVEYYLAGELKIFKLDNLIPFLHFGLTSYDINIPAYGLILKHFKNNVLLGYFNKINISLLKIIKMSDNTLMLGRTHGQPAVPTTMGKELAVFYQRLKKESETLSKVEIEGKLTGAVGNFNALEFVAPEYNWLHLSRKFIKSLGLVPNLVTTQILPYDNWIAVFDIIRRINSILLDLSQDIWLYISYGYFVQQKKEEEVGSSTMSHKINPITFENAEGNLQLANALFEFFSRKLPVSRLQRDLSDSTIKRDFGLAFGFSLLAYDSLLSGLSRIVPDSGKMQDDLNKHWEIFSEGIQTYLRKKGSDSAFELIKKETRGKNLNRHELYDLIDKLPLSKSDKNKLKIKDLSAFKGLTKEIIDIALKNEQE